MRGKENDMTSVSNKIKRCTALMLIALLIASLSPPLLALAAISPLPDGSVADGGAAETDFLDDSGHYSTWTSPGSGFAVSPDYAYRFKQGDATFTPFGRLDSAGGNKAADDHGFPTKTSEDHFIFRVGSGDNTKGKIGMDVAGLKIRNPVTGLFDLVDMKVTVTDWTLASGGTQPYIFIEKRSRTDVILCDVKEAKVSFEYFVAGTNTPYSVKANLTYNDIDNRQYVGIRPSNVTYMYADRESKLSYAKVDGYFVYYAEDHFGNDTSGTPKLAMGITYKTTKLDMVFGTNESKADVNPWSFFGQYAYSMANIVPGAPVKLVSDSDEKDVTDNRLKHTAESFTYEVVQPVPAGLSDNMRYSIFRFEDQIDTCLLIEDVSVRQEGHGDRTDWFTITTTGNKVVAAAKESALENEDFYGGGARNDTEFTLRIKVKIDPSKSAELKTHGHYNAAGDLLTFENTAGTVIRNNVDTYSQDTNKVTTRVALPGKNVSDSDEERVSSDRIINANEPFIYRVRQAILDGVDGEDMRYKSFVMSDVLDACVKVTGVKVVRDDSTDVSGLFDIAVSGVSVTASAKASALADPSFYGAGNGTGYTLLITAALDRDKTYAELKAHGHYNAAEDEMTFPNRATVTIDGSPMTTNEVTTKVGVPDLTVTKAVNRYEHQVGDRVKYTVTVRHTDRSTSDATSVAVKDVSLPEGFDVDPASLKVSGITTRNYTFEIVRGGFIFKTDLIARNETAVITYDAIPDRRSNGRIVDNTVSVTAYSMTSEKKASASVYINSPKLNLLKETHKAEYRVGDTISYKLTLTQINPGTFMRDIIIADSITHGGVTLLPGSIQVLNSENKIITHLCDITVDGNAFTVIPHLNMGYQDRTVPPKDKGIAPYSSLALENRIIVTYDVAVQGPELSGRSVRNVAIAPTRPNTYGDLIKDDPDTPSGGDEEKKDTPIVGAKLRIEKSSDKEVYEVYDIAGYALKVTQIREDYTAKNVTVRDSLDTTLAAIVEGSVKVTLNKKDITSGCAITVSGAALEVKTGKDLAWGDTLLVKYDVSFLPEAEGAVVVNTAIAGADNAGEAQDENTVGVEPGTAVLAIMKESDKTEYVATETAGYTLTATCVSSAPAIGVVIADRLDTTAAAISTGSIKVTLDGEDITSGCKVTANAQDFRIETGRALREGESIVVTYAVSFDVTFEGNVNNVAVASATNAGDVRDDNTVKTRPGKAALTIVKESDKTEYVATETAVYTLTATCVSSAPAIGVVIADRLDTTAAAISAGSIKVTLDGEDITSGCRVTANAQDFRIESGKALKEGESITVTYLVSFDETFEGGTVKNTAVAFSSNAGDVQDDNKVDVSPPVEEDEATPPAIGEPEPVEADNPDPDEDFGSPKTGDDFNPVAAIVLILGLAGIAASLLYRRKRTGK
jgi:fimbrial isopeptide formation D2 family protein/uncharacterized repeat protein (TIGR01451 family)/LPXTG-motif cell wall-anchored protein